MEMGTYRLLGNDAVSGSHLHGSLLLGFLGRRHFDGLEKGIDG